MLYINRNVLSINVGNSLLHFQACLSPRKDSQKVTENASKETTHFWCLCFAAERVGSRGALLGCHAPEPQVTAAPARPSSGGTAADGTQGPRFTHGTGHQGTAAMWGSRSGLRGLERPLSPGGGTLALPLLCSRQHTRPLSLGTSQSRLVLAQRLP